MAIQHDLPRFDHNYDDEGSNRTKRKIILGGVGVLVAGGVAGAAFGLTNGSSSEGFVSSGAGGNNESNSSSLYEEHCLDNDGKVIRDNNLSTMGWGDISPEQAREEIAETIISSAEDYNVNLVNPGFGDEQRDIVRASVDAVIGSEGITKSNYTLKAFMSEDGNRTQTWCLMDE